jgi:type I restriction enzyme, S subunit
MIETLTPYNEYRNSPLPWAPRIPAHWLTKRGKALLSESHLPVSDSSEVVTCFRDGQVTLRKNRRTRGFMMALYEAGYQGVHRGQLVIHAMDAFAGAIGVSDSNGKCTPEYIVCNPRSSDVLPEYFAFTLRHAAHQDFIRASCPAVRERAPRFRYPNLGDMLLPLPPRAEQQSIVRFLDHTSRRIDRFIRAKRRNMQLLAEQRQRVTEDAIESPATRSLRLSVVARRVERPVERQSEGVYTTIGLFNRGRGIFHKRPRRGSELGESTFYWIEADDLVLSGQFAWEGAVAVATQRETRCVVSHRYPVLRVDSKLASPHFLFALLQTQLGGMLLGHHSRGAAGRNRPLNARTLLKEKVPIPLLSMQQRVDELVMLERRLSASVEAIVLAVREYGARLIADVVTGQLDVREAAAKLPVEESETSDAADIVDDVETDDGAEIEEEEYA